MTSPRTAYLLDRVEAAHAEVSLQALTTADNPAGAEWTRFGSVLAILQRTSKTSLHNRSFGFRETDPGDPPLDAVDAVLAWYAERDVPARIDVSPPAHAAPLAPALVERGLEPQTLPFLSRRVLWGPIPESLPSLAGAPGEIVRLAPEEGGLLADLADRIWPGDPELRDLRAQAARRRLRDSRYRGYLLRIEGEPAAWAELFLDQGVAYLCHAATLEPFRGRGCQTALIARRLAEGREAGCTLAMALVAIDSASERNLRRGGLVHHYDREIWMPTGWWQHPFYGF